MSVVAYDGGTLVTDKRATGSSIHTVTKSKQLSTGEVGAWVGTNSAGLALCAWYEAGADSEKFPKIQETDDWSVFIVASANACRYYERTPYATKVEDRFMAWGSGAHFALATMHLMHTALTAAQVAEVFDENCGNGYDVHYLTKV